MLRRTILATAAVLGLLLMSAGFVSAEAPQRLYGAYVVGVPEPGFQAPFDPTVDFVLDDQVRGPFPASLRLSEFEAAGIDPALLGAAAPLYTPAEAEAGLPGGYDPANPFGDAPADSGEGRRIVYSNSLQKVWWVSEDGRVINAYLVSGKRGMPKSGNYRVYSKSEKAYALYGGITMEYMVRFAHGPNGISLGFHTLPEYPGGRKMQTVAELGQFRSGGCVRQADDIAKALYQWADIGTPVVVIP
ncbi:MAG: L,D-transpeptidase [Acidimicrobiia bacterium]